MIPNEIEAWPVHPGNGPAFYSFLEKLPVAAYTCDTKGYITYYNNHAVQIWGRSPKLNHPDDQFCGSFKLFTLDGSSLPHNQCWMALALRNKKEYNGHKIIIECPDKTRRTALVYATPFSDASGQITGAVNVLIDITEPRKSEEWFRIAVEAAPNAMIMVDQQGMIVLVNSQTESLFGYSRDELIGHHMEVLVPERYRQSHPNYRTSFFDNPQARPMGAGRDLHGQRKDGKEVAIEIGLNPLLTEEGSFVLASIIDITERKRTEDRFRVAVEAAPNAMIMVNQMGKIVLVNSQTESLFDYSRDELIDRPVEILVPERYRQGHPNYRTSFFENPHARPMGAGRDLYGRRKDGEEVAIEIGLNPLLTEEGPFVLASIIDITGRKRNEEQIKASLQEKEVLLKEIHHRVKNNLQLVSSLLQLQSGYIDDDKTLSLFQESESRIRSIAMVHEKLYQSKSLAKIDFAEYVNDLISMLFHTYSLSGSDIRLHTEIMPIFIDIDRAVPIGLILNELLTNTFKYAFANSQSGLMSITMSDVLEGQFTLTIADDGIGFPDNINLDNSATLGLRLVRILAKQLKASIDFKTGSAGTSFSFTFPNVV